ncbi:MAG: type II secretion system F family protein [bacterium]
MPIYTFSALKEDNSYIKGKVKARSQKKAIKILEKEKLLTVNIKKEKKFVWDKVLAFSTVSRIDKINFTRHLEAYLEAGVNLGEAVKIAAEQTTNKKLQGILDDIHKKIMGGQSLNGALSQHSKYFSKYFIRLIRVGEESGSLDKILRQLLEQQEKEYELIGTVRRSLTYPIIIILAAIAVVVFMMTFVIPTVAKVLIDYGGKLPLATKILITVSNFLVNFGLLMALLIIVIVVFLRIIIKRTPWGKWYFESFLFSVPILKRIIIEYNIAHFTTSMSAPLMSGIPIDKALELAAESYPNSHYRKTIKESIIFIHRGVSLSEVLRAHPKLYPPNVIRIIEIGERTGRIDNMFSHLANFYQKSVTNTLSNLSTVIEPFLLIAIGLTVCFIAVSILTPIWSFAETV